MFSYTYSASSTGSAQDVTIDLTFDGSNGRTEMFQMQDLTGREKQLWGCSRVLIVL